MHYWDIIFTLIDNLQLKGYLKLREYRDSLPKPKNNNLEDWDSWEEIK